MSEQEIEVEKYIYCLDVYETIKLDECRKCKWYISNNGNFIYCGLVNDNEVLERLEIGDYL